MASEDLECKTTCLSFLLYCLFVVSFSNKYLLLIYLPVFFTCVLYCSEKGRFRAGVGLGAPMKVYIYIKLLYFVIFTNAFKPSN